MGRKLACAVVVAGLLAVLVPMVEAGTALGTICWQKSPFGDVIKAGVSQTGSTFELHGTQATSNYVIPFSGTAVLSGSGVVVGIVFANDPTKFGGSIALKEFGIMSPTTLTMTGTLVGDAFSPSPSTWTPTSCPSGPFGAEREVATQREGPTQSD